MNKNENEIEMLPVKSSGVKPGTVGTIVKTIEDKVSANKNNSSLTLSDRTSATVNKENDKLTPKKPEYSDDDDREENAITHEIPDNVEIKEVNAREKIYETRLGDNINYARVISEDTNDNNFYNTTYRIEVSEENDFIRGDSLSITRLPVSNKNSFAQNFTKPKQAFVGGKKRNTSKIHKKSKKRIIKYKRNTKKSKK